MRARDIVLQLQSRLPIFTDVVTDNVNVTSLTRSGFTVTAVTDSPHGLIPGKLVNIVGAQTPIVINSIDRSGMVATAVSNTDHDLTEKLFKNVVLDGSNEPEFNGTFKLLSVPNRRTFTFQVADSGPTAATGSPLLLNGSNVFKSYNGPQTVSSVIDPTTFQYPISDDTLFTPASGTIVAKTNPRISTAVTFERAKDSYTKQPSEKVWLFVVLNDAVANKNRNIDTDATDNIQRPGFFNQMVIQSVSIFALFPAKDNIAGSQARDDAEELFRPICQSILFSKFDSLLFSGKYNSLMFSEYGFEDYDTSVYSHRYTFEMTILTNIEDTVGPDEDVAFRDISITQGLDVGAETINSEIDLDDEPL